MPITMDGRTATPGATTDEQAAATVAALEREATGYALRERVAAGRLEAATDPVQRAQLQAELERAQRMAGDVAGELTRLRGTGTDDRRPRRTSKD